MALSAEDYLKKFDVQAKVKEALCSVLRERPEEYGIVDRTVDLCRMCAPLMSPVRSCVAQSGRWHRCVS